jgi:uncharacterized protein
MQTIHSITDFMMQRAACTFLRQRGFHGGSAFLRTKMSFKALPNWEEKVIASPFIPKEDLLSETCMEQSTTDSAPAQESEHMSAAEKARQNPRESLTYKSYFQDIMGDDGGFTKVTQFSDTSFSINGITFHTSIFLTPQYVFHWRVNTFEDINPASLSLVTHLREVELLLLGTGKEMRMLPDDLRQHLRQFGIRVEVMPTEHAVGCWNFMSQEGRKAACGLLLMDPFNCMTPEDVMREEEDAIRQSRKLDPGVIGNMG